MSFNSCKEKLAVYSAVVVDTIGNPIPNVEIVVEKNGNLALKKEVEVNKDYYNTTDSLGYFKIGFKEEYFLKPPEILINLQKPGYKVKTIELKWIADVDNIIILENE